MFSTLNIGGKYMVLKQEEHYGTMVWANSYTDELRKSECLCLYCGLLGECLTAKTLLYICKTDDAAMCITRCKNWKPK